MQGFSKADEARRVRDVEAIRRAAQDASSMRGLADAAGITYARMYHLLGKMRDEGVQIRAQVLSSGRRKRRVAPPA